MGVWGLRSTLTVYHNFLPWVVIRWLDGHLLLFRGTLAKSDAGQTIVDPTFHGGPINQLHQQRQRNRKVPVDSENAGVKLKETPFSTPAFEKRGRQESTVPIYVSYALVRPVSLELRPARLARRAAGSKPS